jgi:Zn finger protein HypA/HybF involved in hydrogenase expression
VAEPAFYRCGACLHAWQRTEWKMRQNPPAVCPRCGSADQHTDQKREDAYVQDVYGPIAAMVGDALKKKLEPDR